MTDKTQIEARKYAGFLTRLVNLIPEDGILSIMPPNDNVINQFSSVLQVKKLETPLTESVLEGCLLYKIIIADKIVGGLLDFFIWAQNILHHDGVLVIDNVVTSEPLFLLIEDVLQTHPSVHLRLAGSEDTEEGLFRIYLIHTGTDFSGSHLLGSEKLRLHMHLQYNLYHAKKGYIQ